MGFQGGFRINTNTSAVNTYRSYSSAQAGLERNIERLSSGLRINRAADDSAGLSISQRMNNQIKGMQQANRNVQQANNMMQTAEGGLNQIHSILGRMRELAVQSASDGLNADDRASIDLEFQQLKAEISRIGEATEYNGMKLINGDRQKSTSIPTGSNLSVSTGTAANDHLVSFSVNSNVATGTEFDFIKAEAGEISLRNRSTGEVQTLHQPDGSGFSTNDVLNFDQLGITIELGADFADLNDNAHKGAAATASDGIPASGELGDAYFKVTQGSFTTMQVGSNNDADHAAGHSSDVNGPASDVTENRITLNISDATSKGLGISDSEVSSLSDSQRSINELDAAIAKVNDERSNIGALQNRFEYTSSNLMNSIQNNSASLSTIQDADFAVEAADLARNQILTQSSSAMLAQANQISQNVMGLLR